MSFPNFCGVSLTEFKKLYHLNRMRDDKLEALTIELVDQKQTPVLGRVVTTSDAATIARMTHEKRAHLDIFIDLVRDEHLRRKALLEAFEAFINS